MNNIRADFTGRYTSLTIRSDVKTWVEENYEKLEDDYVRKYKANSFTLFAGVFMLNMFESKAASQINVVRIKEAVFRWLVKVYENRKKAYRAKHGVQSFEQFVDIFLKEVLETVKTAKRILTLWWRP